MVFVAVSRFLTIFRLELHSKWDIFNDFEPHWAFLDFLQILIWENVDAYFHINGHYSQLEMLYFLC